MVFNTHRCYSNKFLYQIKADVIYIPKMQSNHPESNLYGCGLVTTFGLGLIKLLMNYQNNEFW